LTIAIYYDGRARNSRATDASDKRGFLGSLFTNSDRIRLASDTFIENIDIVAASGQVETCI